VAKLTAFKQNLQTSKTPRTLVAGAFGRDVSPLSWDQWIGSNLPAKHAGAYEPGLRLSELDRPDGAEKYRIDVGGSPPKKIKALSLVGALIEMINRCDYDDRIVAIGSNRPIVIWKIPDGLRTPAPCVFWPGASVAESIIVQQSKIVRARDREVCLLRIRCTRRVKTRIESAAEYDRELVEPQRRPKKGSDGTQKHFGRKSNLSAFCLFAILKQVEEVEQVRERAGQFMG